MGDDSCDPVHHQRWNGQWRPCRVQEGKVIDNSFVALPGMDVVDSITDEFCLQTKVAFGDPDDFGEKGGLKGMGESLKRGHVLVMSMWDDHDANMLWLDSDYPLDK